MFCKVKLFFARSTHVGKRQDNLPPKTLTAAATISPGSDS